jgi:sodium-dependent dicarboxylate transporter 2/3/5
VTEEPASATASTPVWRRLGLWLGVVAFFAVALAPSGLHRLPAHGHRPAYAAAVALLMAVWWLTEALPIAVTACAPLVLFPLCGVFGRGPLGDARAAAEPFADAYIFLFMGGMVIGAGMQEHGLHRRLALHIMRAIGTEPRRLLLGMLVATAAVSLWISNTATAVMMVPIAVALVRQLEEETGGRRLGAYGGALLLAVAYAANVGGIGTKIGTGTNSIFLGFASERLGIEVGFLRFMAVGTPFVVLFLPVVWLVLWRHGRADAPAGTVAASTLERELAEMGAMRPGEKRVAVVFAAAAALWIAGDPLRALLVPIARDAGVRLQGKHYEAAVALLAAGVLLSVRGVSPASLRRVPWSTLVLLGGSFSLAAGIEGSGLGAWLAGALGALREMPLAAQLLLASGASVALTAVASNTATINVALNVLPPVMPVLAASTIASSCDFALPAGTPPNAIVFGSGYVRLPVMMRVGALLDVVAALLIPLYVLLYARWLL